MYSCYREFGGYPEDGRNWRLRNAARATDCTERHATVGNTSHTANWQIGGITAVQSLNIKTFKIRY